MNEDENVFEEGEEGASDETNTEDDKTSDETNEDESDDGKADKGDKDKRSAVFQKAKYRERFKAEREARRQTESKIEKLETELSELKKKPEDANQRAALDLIRKEAREVAEELFASRDKSEKKALAEFEEELDSVLEENPDLSEERLLEIVEDLEVTPKIAARILKRETKKPTKPKLPTPKRGSGETKDRADTSKDKGKSMFQIANEEIKKLKEKLS